MKKLCFLTFLLTIIFTSCNKDKVNSINPPPPPDTPDILSDRIVKGKILEYYTERPVEDAAINFSFCRSVTINKKSVWKDTTVKTNSNGGFSFKAEHFRMLKIDPEGFWECSYNGLLGYYSTVYASMFPGNLPIFNYTDDPISGAARSYSCDSLVVNLIQKKNIQVHIKDSLVKYPYGVYCYSAAFGQNSPNVSIFSGNNYFFLRQGVDTTFLFEGFGNHWNSLSCYTANGDPYATDEVDFQYVTAKSFFIRQESDTLINIVY